jgi:hypothetical protein
MAEKQSMTTPEVVAKTLIAEHGDFLRDAVAMVATQLMEAEIAGEIGASRGERSADRATHRNGYRERLWETRVGEIELAVPRKRSGAAYFPSFLEPRRPCEQAIVSVVMEAYVNGVSTRKVDRLVEQLGISSMSKRTGSRRCAENSTSGSRPSATARSKAPSPTCGWTPSTSRSGIGAVCAQGAGDRLRRARDRLQGGDRDRHRRDRDRGLLGPVST